MKSQDETTVDFLHTACYSLCRLAEAENLLTEECKGAVRALGQKGDFRDCFGDLAFRTELAELFYSVGQRFEELEELKSCSEDNSLQPLLLDIAASFFAYARQQLSGFLPE